MKNALAMEQAGAQEFLTFRLGGEEYAIEILKVREIRSWEAPTAIVNAPEYIKGVINLRGTIVPIVDLRMKFKGEAKYDEFTVVIILSVSERVLGIVVDAVSDILTVTEGLIQPAPDVGSGESAAFVAGVMTTETGIVSLLSLDHVQPADTAIAA